MEFTVVGLLTFAGEQAVSSGGSWIATTALEAIGNALGLSNVRAQLAEILANQEKILSELKNVMSAVQWQGGLTRAFASEEDIKVKMQTLVRILGYDDDMQRKEEAKRLRESILDVTQGVDADLLRLHDVLMGITSLDASNQGLLELFAKKLMARYESDTKITWQETWKGAQDFLAAVFHLQLQGAALVANAAPGSHAGETFKTLAANLALQRDKMNSFLPPAMKLLAEAPHRQAWLIRMAADRALVLTGFSDQDPLLFHHCGFFKRYHAGMTAEWGEQKLNKTDQEWYVQEEGGEFHLLRGPERRPISLETFRVYSSPDYSVKPSPTAGTICKFRWRPCFVDGDRAAFGVRILDCTETSQHPKWMKPANLSKVNMLDTGVRQEVFVLDPHTEV